MCWIQDIVRVYINLVNMKNRNVISFVLIFFLCFRMCLSYYGKAKSWNEKYERNICPRLYPKNFVNYTPVGKCSTFWWKVELSIIFIFCKPVEIRLKILLDWGLFYVYSSYQTVVGYSRSPLSPEVQQYGLIWCLPERKQTTCFHQLWSGSNSFCSTFI